MSDHGEGGRLIRAIHTPEYGQTGVRNERPWSLGYGISGYHYLNLISPIIITIIATQDPLEPPQNRWRDSLIPDISKYLNDPFFLYSVIYPNDYEYLEGAVLRGLLSLERRLYLIGWERGLYIPKLHTPKRLDQGCDYTAWCLAQVFREEYLRIWDYYYPELNLPTNKGFLKEAQIKTLKSYKLIPPFVIHERVSSFIEFV